MPKNGPKKETDVGADGYNFQFDLPHLNLSEIVNIREIINKWWKISYLSIFQKYESD